MVQSPLLAGPPKSGRNLVRDEEGTKFIAQFTHAAKEGCIVGQDSGGGLNHGFDNHRADAVAFALHELAQLSDHFLSAIGCTLTRLAQTRGGNIHRV